MTTDLVNNMDWRHDPRTEPPRQVTARTTEVIENCEEVIHLRRQQRLAPSAASKHSVLVVREGMLSIDVTLAKGQRQILDFLMPGDIVSLSAPLSNPAVSLRAITSAALYPPVSSAFSNEKTIEVNDALRSRLHDQLTRAYAQQLMIGHLETEARVASFLLAYASRRRGEPRPSQLLSLPMSRDDIADHLAMNRDTVSRIMMRFEALGLIQRISRHEIRLIDIAALSQRSPISHLIL